MDAFVLHCRDVLRARKSPFFCCSPLDIAHNKSSKLCTTLSNTTIMLAVRSILALRARDFNAQPPHPLIYASLVPASSPSTNYRLDMHRPQKNYTIGRSPDQDLVLLGKMYDVQADWLHCTLEWDGVDEIHIIDNSSTNGTWLNSRRLTPGESCILRDGDSVRLGMCKAMFRRNSGATKSAYHIGYDHSFIFRQFTQQSPPSLPVPHQAARQRLQELDGIRALIDAERLRLQQEEDEMEAERRNLLSSLPAVPLSKPEDFLQKSQEHYNLMSADKRPDCPDVYPADIRDFKPWLLPEHHDMERAFFCANANTIPPPLPWGSPGEAWFRTVHHDQTDENFHIQDWNDPELSWGRALGAGHFMEIDQSSFLQIPPSIIYWSATHNLPVYMHPDFYEMSSGGPYAHPYARSEFGFADVSAADHRAELGLEPLKDPRPIRPSSLLQAGLMPEEKWLAAEVAEMTKTTSRASGRRSRHAHDSAASGSSEPDNKSTEGKGPRPTIPPDERTPLSRKRTADDLDVTATAGSGPVGSSDADAKGGDGREASPVADADENSESESQQSRKRRKVSASPSVPSDARVGSVPAGLPSSEVLSPSGSPTDEPAFVEDTAAPTLSPKDSSA
ncbi:hypothetical protein PENSPDRAFT_754006 [Peniophora sp. CONT]|nr:hypothetical protein PENSPDRAFT_754006 [Peniophora sp. CONT]